MEQSEKRGKSKKRDIVEMREKGEKREDRHTERAENLIGL